MQSGSCVKVEWSSIGRIRCSDKFVNRCSCPAFFTGAQCEVELSGCEGMEEFLYR